MKKSPQSISIDEKDIGKRQMVWIQYKNTTIYIRLFDKVDISVIPGDLKTATLDVVASSAPSQEVK